MKPYSDTFTLTRLWLVLASALVVMFSLLLFFGYEIYQKRPPVPLAYQSPDGEILFDRQDIQRGQNVWQSVGGMQQGSIWGHGGYLAPDWTADNPAQALFDEMKMCIVDTVGEIT